MASVACTPCAESAERRAGIQPELATHRTHYVIVRRDLPLGILAANLVHAAGESSPGGLPEGTHAIVLAVPDEPALRAVLARLKLARVEHVACFEPDPPYGGALMSIGLVPGDKEVLRRHVSSLPLLR